VHRVTLTAAGEEYAPPGCEIEMSIVGDLVFITVYKGSLDDLSQPREKDYAVPEILLGDLVGAIGALTPGLTTVTAAHE
jgi:hypothetical protein